MTSSVGVPSKIKQTIAADMTRLESDPRFVSSTHDGLGFTIFQFIVLSALFPFLWNPDLSYWIHYDSGGRNECCGRLPSKFLSKIIALTGSVLFLVARISYLARAYDLGGRFPCDTLDIDPAKSAECNRARLHVANIILACAAGGIVMYMSFLRLLAPCFADPKEIFNAKARVRRSENGESVDAVAAYRLCAADIEPAGCLISLISTSNTFARSFVLIGLAIDVSSREGKEVAGFGVVGLFLCFCVGISMIWYTFVIHRGKHVIPHQEEAVPITSPEAHEAADVSKRAHRWTAVALWVSGCALLFPVHLLRVGESY